MPISGVGQQKSFADLQTEFGGSHPITMGEYASYRVSGSGNTIDMDDFAGATAASFPASGSAWFQYTSGLGGNAPEPQWGSGSVANPSYAQAFCNVGFQQDKTNDRIAMRWTTFTSAASSSSNASCSAFKLAACAAKKGADPTPTFAKVGALKPIGESKNCLALFNATNP